MKLLRADVVSNTDIYQTGSFQVTSNSFTGPKWCIYTSPYGGLHNPYDGQKAGFFAIPSVGQAVLIAQTDDDVGGDNYYLISVIHDMDNRKDGNSITQVAEAGPVPDDLYKLYPGSPQKVILRDAYANRLVLSHSYADKQNREANRAELIGSKGKRLSLDESPMINRVILENEYKDGFYLSSDESPISPDMGKRHMILRTVGMMQHLSQFGIEMVVTEGTEFDLVNESTGINAASGLPFGNVNIRSKYKDVNITTDGDTGRVMIRALGDSSVIQLNSDGQIIIKAPSDSIYIEGNDINIKASNALYLQGNAVSIKANQFIGISSRVMDIKSETPIAVEPNIKILEGSVAIPLIREEAVEGPDAPSAPTIQNDYEE